MSTLAQVRAAMVITQTRLLKTQAKDRRLTAELAELAVQLRAFPTPCLQMPHESTMAQTVFTRSWPPYPAPGAAHVCTAAAEVFLALAPVGRVSVAPLVFAHAVANAAHFLTCDWATPAGGWGDHLSARGLSAAEVAEFLGVTVTLVIRLVNGSSVANKFLRYALHTIPSAHAEQYRVVGQFSLAELLARGWTPALLYAGQMVVMQDGSPSNTPRGGVTC